MRFFFLLFLLFFTSLSVQAQQFATDSSGHNFGVIREGQTIEHSFRYTNSGTKPLIISDVRLTCGCTAVHWDKEPLLPGDSARLTIRFDSQNKLGRQRKVITLISNAQNAPTRLQLWGTVLPAEDQN